MLHVWLGLSPIMTFVIHDKLAIYWLLVLSHSLLHICISDYVPLVLDHYCAAVPKVMATGINFCFISDAMIQDGIVTH